MVVERRDNCKFYSIFVYLHQILYRMPDLYDFTVFWQMIFIIIYFTYEIYDIWYPTRSCVFGRYLYSAHIL